MTDTQDIKLLTAEDIDTIVNAFATSNWTEKPVSTFEGYLAEQNAGERIVWQAYQNNVFAGYVTLKWQSEYPYFKDNNIPEIKDLNILPNFRNQGVGSALLDAAEQAAFENSDQVGIGVGLYPDYGSAQRLYVKRGYIPDGNGITYEHKTVLPGETAILDDDLILWMVKECSI
ncbi:GNAT family N-acetyltransferase [Rickettsiales bacterium]|nr:GNAT family N-acetyltransferase [Rickettsiales bacterium]